MPAARADVFPTKGSMLAGKADADQRSMSAGRANDFLTERVDAGRQADADSRVDAGRMIFRPRESMLANRPMLTQGSMPAGRADDFPTERVDAGRQADADSRVDAGRKGR
jgi:hypothetical protein